MQEIISLNMVHFKNDKVLHHLDNWLCKISAYNNFDTSMKFIIWTHQSDNDFMALEAKNYMLGFQSYDYKPSAFISSTVNRCDTDYISLRNYINDII